MRDILEAMAKDCKFHLVKLHVDGGMTSNEVFLQLQADLIGLEVIRPTMAESTALVWKLKSQDQDKQNPWGEREIERVHINFVSLLCSCYSSLREQQLPLAKQ